MRIERLMQATVLVREHFSSPLLQLAEQDGGKTFTLVECPSTVLPSLPDSCV